MKVLSVDTSGHLNAVGLVDGSKVLGSLVWEARDNSLRDVVLNIDDVLGNAGLSLGKIDGLGVGIGPGSWTGVRVGLTVGKMLAYATKKPVCGISSLDALAYLGREAGTMLCPLVDAGRGNIYAAFYRSLNETVARESEYYAGSVERLLEMVKEPVLFLGHAAEEHRQAIYEQIGDLGGFSDLAGEQMGCVIARMASLRLRRGEKDDAPSLAPLYLREPLAQALLAQRTCGVKSARTRH